MIPKHISFLFLGLIVLLCNTSLAQNKDSFYNKKRQTLAQYHIPNNGVVISAKEYPTQIARFTIDRPGFIKKIVLHLNGVEKGTFNVHIYGHESGTNFPVFAKDLTPPVKKKKKRKGYEKVVVKLKKPVFVENDQFYISLSDFTGDFGLQQDDTFYQEFCCATDGGNYYPTLLVNNKRQILGENCNLTVAVEMNFVPAVPPIFKDINSEVGLPTHLNNEHIAWGDLNQDNWLDLIVGGRIYQNNRGQFTDITEQVAAVMPTELRGATFADMNNDGQQDILLFGKKNSLLYLNQGNGNFEKKTLNIPPLPSLHAYSMADIDKDNFLDLVLVQLWEPYPVPHPNYLFLNDGQNNFIDITQRLYPEHSGRENFPKGTICLAQDENTFLSNGNKNRRSRGSQFTDIDLDGDLDLYITNYFLETDELYLNDGQGYFTSATPPKPIGQSSAVDNHGTGLDWYDFDNDGDFDLLLPQLAHPPYLKKYDHRGTTIFRNDDGTFVDLRGSHGIKYEETHAGSTFGDVNNDGLVDLLTTVYYGCRYVDLYLQNKNHQFELNTYQSGLSKIATGNDACFVDYNNDGLLDLAMGIKGKFHLFKNNKPTKNAWIKIQVNSSNSNYFGIGTLVKIYTKKQTLTQEINLGRGQRMQKPSILHFGLGDIKGIEKIEVLWPTGKAETFYNFQLNQSYTLSEGGGVILHKK